MFAKYAQTQVPIHDLLASRWSGRAYDPARPLSREQIISLLEAARWAPSCYGDQPWRYIVFDKGSGTAAWQRALDCLSEGNRSWAVNAPLLLLAVADTALTRDGSPNRWGQYDTGAASMSICVQATALGLMAHQMGGFDSGKAREMFAIPERYIPMAMLAVGYQLPVEEIPAGLMERERSGRRRNSLGENFFEGEWGRAVVWNV